MAARAAEVQHEIRAAADPECAAIARSFFKTGRGEYGHGDRFLGLTVPEQRRIARRHADFPWAELRILLRSAYHEERFVALIILTMQFERGDAAARTQIVRRYRTAIVRSVNNWDLVDATAYKILGEYLRTHPTERRLLVTLARSRNLWERRVAIIATLAFIARNEFTDTFRIADILLADSQDLIHKAVGWMLREVGKRDRRALEAFLRTRHTRMPRTMLRYAIERFPENKRRKYLR
ncbi:MAG: DNA alkylation repair protein [bacterium]|nr:DNA alkylation repair protein [bacterium]